MKKLFALFLTIVMVLSMSVTVFASTIDELNNSSVDVYGEIVDKSGNYIDISLGWDDITFYYNINEYDPSTGEDKEGYWSGYGAIQIINYSNVGIDFTFTFEAASNDWDNMIYFENFELEDYQGTWDDSTNTLSIPAGSAGTSYNGGDLATQAMVNVYIDEDNAPAITDTGASTKIGTITVTITTAE
ncbi:MAG: hypothetical protein IJY12_02910 [Clostridia bacterium]|nr:hypothetical protein [Clostridia bacterium]